MVLHLNSLACVFFFPPEAHLKKGRQMFCAVERSLTLEQYTHNSLDRHLLPEERTLVVV